MVAFLPGEQYGNAIADIIFGDATPQAKLPLTFPNVANEQKMTTSQYPGVKTDLYVIRRRVIIITFSVWREICVRVHTDK